MAAKPTQKRNASSMLKEAVTTVSAGMYMDNSRDMFIGAHHVQAYATLRAAELIAEALDRNTAAIKAQAKPVNQG